MERPTGTGWAKWLWLLREALGEPCMERTLRMPGAGMDNVKMTNA
jgi:hypothetical protein